MIQNNGIEFLFLIETGAIIESDLGRSVDPDDIEPIKQLIEYYKLKKQNGQPIHTPKLQSSPNSSEQK